MLSSLLTIAVLHWVALVIPGVNFILVVQLAAGSSRPAAYAAAVGITCVSVLWAMLSILGVGAVFNLHPALRHAAQVAGGAYLCFLAYRLWRGGVQMAPVGTLTLSRSAAFRRGFLTNVLNPKSVLFFGSVFATSLPPNPGWPLIVAAVALVWVNAFAWHMALAMVFSQQRVQVAYRRFSTAFGWMAGAFLGAFGVRLLFSTWREWRTRLA